MVSFFPGATVYIKLFFHLCREINTKCEDLREIWSTSCFAVVVVMFHARLPRQTVSAMTTPTRELKIKLS